MTSKGTYNEVYGKTDGLPFDYYEDDFDTFTDGDADFCDEGGCGYFLIIHK